MGCPTPATQRKLEYAFHVTVLVLTNITCVALACFFAMVCYYETTDRLPYLTQYKLHHWINILISVVALFSQSTSLLLLHTITLDKFNFGRYRKLNPCMVGFGVIFGVFGVMELARYIGMNVTNQDLFLEIKNHESSNGFRTGDGFNIPAWFDYIQEKKQCCGVINFHDYDAPGKLNGTQVDATGIPRGSHGVPKTCCLPRQPACGEAVVFRMKPWEQKQRFPQEGCGRLIEKMISNTVYIGMSLCLGYSVLCFLSWMALRSVSEEVIREMGRRDTRTIKTRYNYAEEGYLSHLQNIYMDVATGESEPEHEGRSDEPLIEPEVQRVG